MFYTTFEFIRKKVVATDHSDYLAGPGIQGHHRALHAGNLIQLNFQSMGLLVNFFDDELRE